jgi:hypothetical protein
MTTEPGRLDKPSRALVALHHDLDTLTESIARLRAHAADLERVGFSRDVTPDHVSVTKSGWSGSEYPMRFPTTEDGKPKSSDDATFGELWSRQGQPLARKIFRDIGERVEHLTKDLVRCESLMMNFLNHGTRPVPGGSEVIPRVELAAALEAKRRRERRGEEAPVRMPGQTQPKWSSR